MATHTNKAKKQSFGAAFLYPHRGGDLMANRIKGITVEINGDTTKLSKALDSVNKSIRSTQSQLKDVVKLDPKNTELVAQKQRLLSKAVSDTSEKTVDTEKCLCSGAETA